MLPEQITLKELIFSFKESVLSLAVKYFRDRNFHSLQLSSWIFFFFNFVWNFADKVPIINSILNGFKGCAVWILKKELILWSTRRLTLCTAFTSVFCSCALGRIRESPTDLSQIKIAYLASESCNFQFLVRFKCCT